MPTSVQAPETLIDGWCQQYPSHSLGSLAFGSDGALYVSSGDGASFTFTDYGQKGNPLNPCGDAPGSEGTALTPPTAEGGALRSQAVRGTADPVPLNGSAPKMATVITVADTIGLAPRSRRAITAIAPAITSILRATRPAVPPS